MGGRRALPHLRASGFTVRGSPRSSAAGRVSWLPVWLPVGWRMDAARQEGWSAPAQGPTTAELPFEGVMLVHRWRYSI